jgi:pyruvate ferredoxin oxidoreductase gamma subunit
VTKIVTLEAFEGALQERFGKKFVASGGTASLDEAIKKKYKKKNDLLKANMDCIKESYSRSEEWAAKQENLQLIEV